MRRFRSFSATQDSDRSGVSLAEVDATDARFEKTSLSSARLLLYPKRRKEGGREGQFFAGFLARVLSGMGERNPVKVLCNGRLF